MRGITRMTKRASSLSRKLRHLVYSWVSKIFARSRGLASSVPAVEAEHAGAGGRDERRERRRRDVGHQAQRLDVVRMLRPLVVADQRAVGLAARRAELVLVDLLEQLALVELDRALQIARQVALRQVQHAQLQAGAGLAVHHQVVQSAPACLPASRNFGSCMIALSWSDSLRSIAAIARSKVRVRFLSNVTVPGERLLDQVLHQVLRLIGCGLLGGGDDLIEEGYGLRWFRSPAGLCCGLCA